MKLVRLDSLFYINSGNDLELCNLNKSSDGINFVSRTSKNHGVSARVIGIDNNIINVAGTITVAVGGSVLETFLQYEPYVTGYHIKILSPISEMTDNQKLYYCACIKANRYRYNYGRQANSSLKSLEVPSLKEVPKWAESVSIGNINFLTKSINSTKLSLPDLKKWRPFKLKDLFETITQCKCGNAGDLKDGDDIWYIGAKKKENGLMKKVIKQDDLISKGNCIILIGDGQGSVGYANYIDQDFIGSTTLYAAYSKNIDKYTGLFIVGLFTTNRFRFNYGRKFNGNRLYNTEILLPVILDENDLPKLNEKMEYEPDYVFMRNYIKCLPYSKYI